MRSLLHGFDLCGHDGLFSLDPLPVVCFPLPMRRHLGDCQAPMHTRTPGHLLQLQKVWWGEFGRGPDICSPNRSGDSGGGGGTHIAALLLPAPASDRGEGGLAETFSSILLYVKLGLPSI